MDRVFVRAWRAGMFVEVSFFGPAWLDQAKRFVECWEPTALAAMTEHAEECMRWCEWTAEEMRRAA